MESAVERGLDWARLPAIATVARLLSSFAATRRAVAQSRGASRS